MLLAATEQVKTKSFVVPDSPTGRRVTLTVAAVVVSASNVKVDGNPLVEQSPLKS